MFNLDHTCTVQRATVTADRYNNEKRDYGDLDLFVPCRLITTAQNGIDSIAGQLVVSTGYKMLLAPGQDVIAGDRITEVTDRAGASVAGVYDVIAAIPHNGAMARHLSLELEKVH